MKLVSLKFAGWERAALEHAGQYVLMEEINRVEGSAWGMTVLEILQQGQLEQLIHWYRERGDSKLASIPSVQTEDAMPAPLFRQPRKIWGIGMNYVQKAIDLAATPPEAEPICFMKRTQA
jgi:2-keto-4-pentenoate hydratase/2-oxohepta-3-ene-1,7-dioic acid hydratase in catechol pathway